MNRMLEKHVPKDRDEWLSLRLRDVTSTEVAALFGLSPYITLFELWHWKKQGVIPPFEENERMRWGKRLEPAIAAQFAEDHGWKIRPKNEYIRHTGLRMGASFDFAIVEGIAGTDIPGRDIGFLEIKNVDYMVFKNEWIANDDGTYEAPPHIELQVQQQFALEPNLSEAYIGVLVGGNTPYKLPRAPNPTIIEKIRAKVAEFWISIEENRPPPPDFKRDARFIASLYSHSEPGSVLEAADDVELATLAEGYRYAGEQEKAAKLMKDTAKAQILMRIKDAEKALGRGFTISAGLRGPVVVPEHERAGFRDFRISWKKIKEVL